MIRKLLLKLAERIADRTIQVKCDYPLCDSFHAGDYTTFDDAEKGAVAEGWQIIMSPAGNQDEVGYEIRDGKFYLTHSRLTFPRSHHCPKHEHA